MGGISGEADEEVDISAVSLNSYRGCTKLSISLEPSVRLIQILTQYSSGCALPLGGIIFMQMTLWGAQWCTKNGIGAPRMHFMHYFSAWTLKTRKDTTWSVPIWFLCVSWSVSLAMWLEQWVSITLKHIQYYLISDNVPWNMSPLLCSCHHVVIWCCEMKWLQVNLEHYLLNTVNTST